MPLFKALPMFVFAAAVAGASCAEENQGRRQVEWKFKTDKPEGAVVLLPRDAIAAVFDPTFVSAEEAKMPDDAEVIGVAIGEEARAYSINLLDRHEIVNDVVGGVKIATTW